MNPKHGEVWLADMGMAAKTRPTVILLADHVNAPRSLVIHVPITRQNRGSDSAPEASVVTGWPGTLDRMAMAAGYPAMGQSFGN